MIADEKTSWEAAMPPYCGIETHSNNSVIYVINDKVLRFLETKVD